MYIEIENVQFWAPFVTIDGFTIRHDILFNIFNRILFTKFYFIFNHQDLELSLQATYIPLVINSNTQKNRTFNFSLFSPRGNEESLRRSRALPTDFISFKLICFDWTIKRESCRCRDWRQWGGTPIVFSSRSSSMEMHKKDVVEKKRESTPHGHWKLNNRCGNHEETYYFARVRVVRFSSFKVSLTSRYFSFNDSISIGFVLFPTFFFHSM